MTRFGLEGNSMICSPRGNLPLALASGVARTAATARAVISAHLTRERICMVFYARRAALRRQALRGAVKRRTVRMFRSRMTLESYSVHAELRLNPASAASFATDR